MSQEKQTKCLKTNTTAEGIGDVTALSTYEVALLFFMGVSLAIDISKMVINLLRMESERMINYE